MQKQDPVDTKAYKFDEENVKLQSKMACRRQKREQFIQKYQAVIGNRTSSLPRDDL